MAKTILRLIINQDYHCLCQSLHINLIKTCLADNDKDGGVLQSLYKKDTFVYMFKI